MTCSVGNETKKKLLYINVGVYGILNAVEYSVILPTIWLYVSGVYHSQSWYFGLCISAFHMSSLLFAPLFGLLNDRGIKTKRLVMFANLFQVLGSVLYLIRIEWLVFTARFVAGVGSAVGSLLYADVNRVTDAKSRTSVIAILMLCRQIGLFVGPAFNLFLSLFHFRIGPLLVDRFTAPGFLMTILWIVYQVFMAVTYYNADELLRDERVIERTDDIVADDANQSSTNNVAVRASISDDAERPFVISNANYGTNSEVLRVETPKPTVSSESSSSSPVRLPTAQGKDTLQQSINHYLKEFSSESLIVLNTLFFISYFVQMTLETMVTPLTEKFFHYGEFENALFFAIAGGLIFVVCIFVSCLSKVVDDRLMTLIGLILMLISIIWIVVVVPTGEYGQKFLLFHFVGACAFDIIGLTIVCITGFSLYTKLVKQSSQGFGMGLRRTMTSCGLILGPLWAGSMIDDLLVMLIVVLALLLLSVSMYAWSYRRLSPSSDSPEPLEERV